MGAAIGTVVHSPIRYTDEAVRGMFRRTKEQGTHRLVDRLANATERSDGGTDETAFNLREKAFRHGRPRGNDLERKLLIFADLSDLLPKDLVRVVCVALSGGFDSGGHVITLSTSLEIG